MHCVRISPQSGPNQATESAYSGRRHQHSTHKTPENVFWNREAPFHYNVGNMFPACEECVCWPRKC
jgi:hypothetical protein